MARAFWASQGKSEKMTLACVIPVYKVQWSTRRSLDHSWLFRTFCHVVISGVCPNYDPMACCDMYNILRSIRVRIPTWSYCMYLRSTALFTMLLVPMHTHAIDGGLPPPFIRWSLIHGHSKAVIEIEIGFISDYESWSSRSFRHHHADSQAKKSYSRRNSKVAPHW